MDAAWCDGYQQLGRRGKPACTRRAGKNSVSLQHIIARQLLCTKAAIKHHPCASTAPLPRFSCQAGMPPGGSKNPVSNESPPLCQCCQWHLERSQGYPPAAAPRCQLCTLTPTPQPQPGNMDNTQTTGNGRHHFMPLLCETFMPLLPLHVAASNIRARLALLLPVMPQSGQDPGPICRFDMAVYTWLRSSIAL